MAKPIANDGEICCSSKLMIAEPNASNGFLHAHVEMLLENYARWTGKSLVPAADLENPNLAQSLYDAPFVVLSHDTADDPIFNYANLTGQTLFEMSWPETLATPSRFSAEPLIREERLRLFDRVASHGFIEDYKGVRISRTGRRFYIDRATVWTVLDREGNLAGQAAMFAGWDYL